MSDKQDYDSLLETQGMLCPEPVMMLHSAIDTLAVGQVVKIIATDPSTQRDIPKFCEFLSHTLIEATTDDDVYCFWVKRGH